MKGDGQAGADGRVGNLRAEIVLSLGVSALKRAVGRQGTLCRAAGSIPAPPSRATRLRMLLRAHESGILRFASAQPCRRFDWQTEHVALSGKELTPHRSSISAQACAAGQAESSMRSRLSIPAPPGRAARLRMLLRTRMSRAARALIPHGIAYGLIGKHVALSGKDLTLHSSSISAQACADGRVESSMRSRLRIPAPPGRATRLRMLLRAHESGIPRFDSAQPCRRRIWQAGNYLPSGGGISEPPSSIGRLHMSVQNAHGRRSLLSRPSPNPTITSKAPDRTARSGALFCHFAKEILTTVLAYASNNAIITVFKRFR